MGVKIYFQGIAGDSQDRKEGLDLLTVDTVSILMPIMGKMLPLLLRILLDDYSPTSHPPRSPAFRLRTYNGRTGSPV